MQVIQEQYKDTKVGRIPKDWEILKLGDIFTFKNGLNKAKEFFGYGIPIVNYMDVFRNDGVYLKDLKGKVHLTSDEIKRFNIKKGDVFFTRTSETKEEIGYSTVLLEDVKDGVFSGFVLRARTESKKLNLFYRKYCFSSNIARKQIYATSSISTRALTNGSSLSLVKIPLPPLPEQQKIADILSTVDEQISTTQAIIDKSKELKKGLMQKLFSEGIGHTEFKDTKIGRIPKDWEVVSLGNALSKIVGGGTPSRSISEYWNGEIPWASVKDFTKARRSSTKEYITQDGLKNSSSNLIPKNTLIIPTRMGLGRVIEFDVDVAINQDLKALFPKNNLLKDFLNCWLQSIAKKIEDQGTGSTVKGIRLDLLKSFLMVLPSLSEQQKIAEILSEADAKIEKEEQEKVQLEQLKKGLMQQLLTGQKRVKL